MIVSASYKTDIPAFYGEWFMNRLADGYCLVRDPWRGGEAKVSLKKEDVDAIVFWTKNIGPFVERLDKVASAGYPFLVQYTINGYPRDLETSVVDWEKSVGHVVALAEKYRPGIAVWRYDPVVVTGLTDLDFHASNFEAIAGKLKGAVDEVVVSFVHLYDKTLRNMDNQAARRGFEWRVPDPQEKKRLLGTFVNIAAENGMKVTICSQPENIVPGVEPARCVDAARIKRIWGSKFASKTKANRPGCLCANSKDIGEYDTCPHGCAYCYAVQTTALAKARYRLHDPSAPTLFSPSVVPNDEDVEPDVFE